MRNIFIFSLLLCLQSCFQKTANTSLPDTKAIKKQWIQTREEVKNDEIPITDSIFIGFGYNLSGAYVVVWADKIKIFEDCIMPRHYSALAYGMEMRRCNLLKVAIHYNDSLLSYYEPALLKHYRDTFLIEVGKSNYIYIDDSNNDKEVILRKTPLQFID
jgi:hypothetical protein